MSDPRSVEVIELTTATDLVAGDSEELLLFKNSEICSRIVIPELSVSDFLSAAELSVEYQRGYPLAVSPVNGS